MKISTGELEAHTLAKRRVMLKTEAQDLKLFGFPIFHFERTRSRLFLKYVGTKFDIYDFSNTKFMSTICLWKSKSG
jgi:hypothetical protein